MVAGQPGGGPCEPTLRLRVGQGTAPAGWPGRNRRAKQSLPGPIYTHGAVEAMNRAYRAEGVDLPVTTYVAEAIPGVDWTAALVIAPPSAHGTPWTRRFGPASTAFASGWMRIRGTRRRRAVDRGFVLSDHADWPGLLTSIDATTAETVWLTHGYTAVVARWLCEQGKDAHLIATRYEGERNDVTETGENLTRGDSAGRPVRAGVESHFNPVFERE